MTGALMGMDGMTGAIHHLPFSGGFLDQPVKTLSVVHIVRGVFGEKIAEDGKASRG